MARGTKKESLTPEERLQAALVPESEQPYPVPENWCWVSLQTIDQYQASSIDPSKYPDTLFELYSVPSSADNYPEIVLGCEIGSTKQSVQKGDILLCKINPRINRVWKVSQYTKNALLASSEWIIVRNSKIVSDYLMYCFRSPYFREYMLSNVSGVGGSLMRAQPKYVKNYPVPLPPFAEQQRIVDRIESLFAKLDEAKQKAQDALDSFETRKAAILHKAFAGELTAQWRKEHGLEVAAWIEEKLKNCITLLSGQDFSPDKYNSEEKGIPYITGASNFENSHVCINRWTEKPSVIAQKGDILLVCKGSGYGKTVIADFEYAHIARQIMSLRVTAQLSNQFLLYYLQNNIRYIRESGQGLIPGISRKIVLDMEILLPSINEQFEIIRILDGLFAEEQQAKEAAEGVLEQIDLIKKAILAHAFRGELGTNDPSEESAVELLKRVL